MGQPKITFIRKDGLVRRDSSLDHISGLLFYSDSLPSGFSSSDRVKKIFSVEQAETLGITDDHSDETVATGGNVEVTTAGGTGDVNTIKIDGVVLGSYTVAASDTPTLVAVGLRAAVNALTSQHGFVAAGSTAHVALTAPDAMGIVPNGATISFTSSGTGAATVTQFSSGVGSFKAVMHYHISEFFREKPDGILYVGIYAEATYTGAEVYTMQVAANGEMRQLGIFIDDAAFASSQLTATQTYLDNLRAEKKNLFALLHADMSSATLATLADLSLLSASKVGCVLGEDGNYHQLAYSATKSYVQGDKAKWLNKTYICNLDNTGQPPYDETYWVEVSLNLTDILGHSISTLGSALGVVASIPVNESIAYVEKNQLASGNTLDVAGFATGDLYQGQAPSLLDTLTEYHYIFLRKFQDNAGTYYNDSWTATAESGDYATIENNRTMDKIERLVYLALLPKLNAPLFVDSDGKLSQDTVDLYENIASNPLEGMLISQEISSYSVTIDPDRDVLTTSKLIVVVKAVPVGVAREIEVNNSFTVNVS